MRHFGDIMFTGGVKAEQSARGSRAAYAKMTAQPAPEGLTERERAFIAARDSFYIASVNEEGWPYVQHRGGPKGFLAVLDETTLAMADYRGNKQYVSTGNFKNDDRASLFLMDYPNRARLKILARAAVIDADADPDLAARLAVDGGGRVERLFTFAVEAFDWNCPQFITPRFTEAEIAAVMEPKVQEMERLSAENETLKARLAALDA
jgi:predicted pyridoxine 5'-phosphate oxidase superfamily flavin-nucleotide-binding protein